MVSLPSSQFYSSMLSFRPLFRPNLHASQTVVLSVLSPPSQDLTVNQSGKLVEKSTRGNLVPLSQCIFSDHLTPTLAYRCLVKENDHEAPSFLIESVEPGLNSGTVGRYSIVGANPAMEIIAKEYVVTVINHREGWRTEEFSDDPMVIPRTITEKWTPQFIDELPQVFCGGWVGYLSYDTVRYTEKRLPFSGAPADDRNIPDVHLGLFDDVLVFDHVEKKIHAIHWVQLDKFSSIDEALDKGMIRLNALLSKIHDIVNPRLLSGSIEPNAQKLHPKLEVSSVRSEAYKAAVMKAKEHMIAGDALHQVVLSQRFERRTFADPFEVYRALSIVDPNPFIAYIQVRGAIFVASSPEILTYVDKKGIVTDQTLSRNEKQSWNIEEKALLGKPRVPNEKKLDVKDMQLTDWQKNYVEKGANTYSTCWDALQDALSLEVLTRAPKIESMQLIDKLEQQRRGPYGGSFGCISFTKDMDLALAPKTLVFPTGKSYDTLFSYKHLDIRKEWVAHIQTGAAITPDSDSEDHQRQCEREASRLARAIDMAESSFLR